MLTNCMISGLKMVFLFVRDIEMSNARFVLPIQEMFALIKIGQLFR